MTTPPEAPRAAFPMAAGGITLISIAVVLLAVGGILTIQDPTHFDLWMLAVGLFVLAAALGGLGRSAPDGPPAPVVTSREYPSRPGIVPAGPPPSLAGSEGPPAGSSASAAPVSSSIAGQYFEVARGTPMGRGAIRRAPERSDDEIAFSSVLPFSAAVRRSTAAPPRQDQVPTLALTPDTELEGEIARLRARVTELEEAGRLPEPAAPSPPSAPPPGCAGCGRPLPVGPGASSCPSCGRPLCSECYGRTPDGPRAHRCPDCPAPATVPGPRGERPRRRKTAEAR